MANNNLRIIYQNLVDIATTTVTSTVTSGSVDNLKLDTKSLVAKYGTTGNTTAIITVSFPTTTTISSVVLPFSSLTTNARISIAGGPGVTSYACCGWANPSSWSTGLIPVGTSGLAYGGGNHARVYFTPVSTSSITITITDSSAITLSRLIVGNHWSPTYNTSFGISTAFKDLSTTERTEAGDLITNRGTLHNSMNFQLEYMTPSDRTQFMNILKGNAKVRPIFVSAFPHLVGDTTTADSLIKEQAHQIYGKLTDLPSIQYPMFDIYSTQVDLEEI